MWWVGDLFLVGVFVSLLLAGVVGPSIAMVPFRGVMSGHAEQVDSGLFVGAELAGTESGMGSRLRGNDGARGSGTRDVAKLDPVVTVQHRVEKGETLWSIAKLYGTTVESIRGTNNLEYTYVPPGRVLLLVNKRGVMTRARRGDTAEKVARRFKVPVEAVLQANRLSGVGELERGRELFIPGFQPRFRDFSYPIHGSLSSRFGYRNHPIFGEVRMHEGLDLKREYRAPVRAARSGRVLFSGWKAGYGKLVELAHPGGYTTRYGHLSSILVKRGQRVESGQLVGRVGATGWATGPHLHFEIRKLGQAVNPIRYLTR